MRAQSRSSPSFRCITRCFTSGSQLCLSDLFSSANRVSFVERVSKVPRLTRSGVSNVSPINRAAVLVPLIKSVDGAPSLLFTERSTQLRSHAGHTLNMVIFIIIIIFSIILAVDMFYHLFCHYNKLT